MAAGALALRAAQLVAALAGLAGAFGCNPSRSRAASEPAAASIPGAPSQPSAPPGESRTEPRYLGTAICASCHAEQAHAWRGSVHDLAMQSPDGLELPGFDGRSLRAGQERFTFRHDAEGYVVDVNTSEAISGTVPRTASYRVRYLFGVRPLQQVLLDVGKGQLQALSVAWDTRPKAVGGQRWFYLYPGEQIPPGDALHWRGPQFNWNHMCADCHSTGVQKNYQRSTRSYATHYEEIDVGCEACHGPGSEHARAVESGQPLASANGFRSLLRGPSRRWVLPEGAPIAHLERDGQTGPAIAKSTELETCAPCHSRRSDLGPASAGALDHGYADRYRLALIEDPLYFADGQIEDEVFEYGSFVQSRMYHAGVTCSDCHDPHALELRAPGNELCGRCHRPEVFDTPAHHFHAAGSRAAACVSCHMPARTYMQLDERHDHRFGLPRPELSEAIHAPDACTGCHTQRSQRWAAEQIRERREPRADAGFARTLQAARVRLPGAEAQLRALLADAAQPAMARASALAELANDPGTPLLSALNAALGDRDALVRRAAVGASATEPPLERDHALARLLQDPARSVRIEAASILVGQDPAEFGPATRKAFPAALAEYTATQEYIADRAEGLNALANLRRMAGDVTAAEALLVEALERDPTFSGTYVNLADLYRATDREPLATQVLERGLESATDRALLHYALGLSYIRSGRKSDALRQLERASRLGPRVVRYSYVYAVSLHDAGRPRPALDVLRAALQQAPGNAELLSALLDYSREADLPAEAAGYARRLAELHGTAR